MPAYYNEFDPFAASWLRELIKDGLIAPGDVDERSIVDVQPQDLEGYTQCHFFAGIGGWSAALRLAGWPDEAPVWTGSCPCQTHSSAARGRHTEPDWWPEFRRLIASGSPRVVFGEQVAAATHWLSVVGDEVEAMGYGFGSAIIPACSVGADHVRQRIWFVGYANSDSEPKLPINAKASRMSWDTCFTNGVVPTHGISARVAYMRGFGNAIHPQVAAEFTQAFCESLTL